MKWVARGIIVLFWVTITLAVLAVIGAWGYGNWILWAEFHHAKIVETNNALLWLVIPVVVIDIFGGIALIALVVDEWDSITRWLTQTAEWDGRQRFSRDD